jgi:dihydrodipicolinate synthase/N-acetylneuraminate lyase
MEFRGVYSALVTPFGDDGELSAERLEAYCRFLIRRGVDGLFPFGTTGEWPHLSPEERRRGAEVVIRVVGAANEASGGSGAVGGRGSPRRRVAAVIHTGANDTATTAALSAHAREIGADAVGVISPAYYRLDEEALFDHFTAVAREVQDTPLFLYNIPGMTGNDIPPALLLRIAGKADNVVGLKYSCDNLPRFREYRRLMGPTFALFIGDDGVALPALHEGASGIVSGNSSAVPDLLVRLFRLYGQGRAAEAADAQAVLDEFIGSVDGSAELSSFKRILAVRGVPVGEVRRPLKPLSVESRAALESGIRALEGRGVLEPSPAGGPERPPGRA